MNNERSAQFVLGSQNFKVQKNQSVGLKTAEIIDQPRPQNPTWLPRVENVAVVAVIKF